MRTLAAKEPAPIASAAEPPIRPKPRHRCAAGVLRCRSAFVAVLCLAPVLAWGDEPDSKDGKSSFDAAEIAFFESKVRPILANRCYECHGPDEQESELRVDSLAAMLTGGTIGPAIKPGKPKESLLISAINHGEIVQMPPDSKLPPAEIAILTRWITRGAAWPDAQPATGSHKTDVGPLFTEEERNFWAFQPPVAAAVPAVKDMTWPQSAVDSFILSQLEAAGLKPAVPADKRTLLRRATFDLTGLPPTLHEVNEFLADESPQAFARVVDRLLASPRYGERWGRHWLDITRYADSNGMDENLAYANAYRYRDYVIAAFNRDKPYDMFVREQLAGDLMGAESPQLAIDRIIATGFLTLGPKMLAEDDPVKMQMDIIDEQIDTVGKAFLGLTLGCARCHDHKFDPIPMADYYSLAGVFKSTKTMDNFKVVARWHERGILPPEEQKKANEQTSQIEATRGQIAEFTKTANERLLTEARGHVADYLLAGSARLRQQSALEGLTPVMADDGGAETPGLLVIEAEKFTGGNVKIDFETYGNQIGVILNGGELPNVAEYEFDVVQPGTYQLELRYAAAEARPVRLTVNGELKNSQAAGNATGSWTPETQKWHVEGIVTLAAGKNTIRLERDGPFPHFDKVLIVPQELPASFATTSGELLSSSQLANRADLDAQFIEAWADYLKKTRTESQSVFRAWHDFEKAMAVGGDGLVASMYREFAADARRKLAERYEQMILAAVQAVDEAGNAADSGGQEEATPADSEQVALRQVLFDAKGPFALPKKPEDSYPDDDVAELKELRGRLAQLESTLPEMPVAMAVEEGTIENVRVHLRGSHLTLGDEMPRRFPRILSGEDEPAVGNDESGRLQFARWITTDRQPLTSRVMVNRIWRWHFGTGLVRSVDNFGRLGERADNQQLLDWLAVRFIESGWSVKSIHRLIMLSSTYRMSTAYDSVAAEKDPENRLHWRTDRRRLESEAIRDAILSAGGALDLAMGGSLLTTENRKYVTSTASVDATVYDSSRRSVYLPVVRSALYEVFQAFDMANPSAANGDRSTTTVAPQALFAMNSPLVRTESRRMAERLLQRETDTDADRVVMAYEICFSRPPTDEEVPRALDFIDRCAKKLAGDGDPAECRSRAWQSLCRVLMASNEFVYVE